MDFADSPAELVARKFVVTVESTRIMTPGVPRPMRSIDCAMLVDPIPTIPMPIKYIHKLAIVYAVADAAVAFTGFSTSFV